MSAQVLDSMDIERERGITIKAQSVTLDYKARDGNTYQLNFIDTPGHVDFSYEVSRSLAACEGALLVVDAAQGVEAQSVANCYTAIEQGLEVLPVLNKVDLPSAEPDRVMVEIEDVIGIPADNALKISAKTGAGVDDLLNQLIEKIPEPYRPGLPGEELAGVYEATEFLSRANLPTAILPLAWQAPLELGPRIHVLGGGSTAMDGLRTALRLPQTIKAACYYRRSAEQMPSDEESYRHALEEGAAFTWLAGPLEFVGNENGALTAIRYQRMQLGAPDKSGRRRPLPIPGETFTVPADAVILAFGYRPDPDFTAHLGVATERWGTIKVETRANGQTSVPGIFAAGDIVRGADLLAPAVADALHVAEAMEAYLRSS